MLTPELPGCLFLHASSYLGECRHIDAPPGQGPGQTLTEDYAPDERFLTRISLDQEQHFSRHGGDQAQYSHRIGETVLALSRVLWACNGNMTVLPDQFAHYWRGYDQDERPHGLYTTYLSIVFDLKAVLWTYTGSPCELFFSYLACHRHLIAQEAIPDDEAKTGPFGRNRYFEYLTATSNEERGKLISYLQTDLNNPPYLTSLNKFYDQGGTNSHFISRDLNDLVCPFGFLTKGVLVNWLTPPNCYEAIFAHMNELFASITGPELPDARRFLEHVFEIQYWYIHVMPCERGSLAVMNMFRYTMLAYYNRRQPDEAKWLPMAPNRTDIYPDLEALFLRTTMDEFIHASFQELYCVDYGAYCED